MTRVTWYAAPAAASSLGAARGTFDTSNTLAALNATNFWLGRSEYPTDMVASASYDEMRLWDEAFTASQLNGLHVLGPNNLGAYTEETVAGSLAGTNDVMVSGSGTLNIGAATQSIGSLSGSAGSTLVMNSGELVIGGGTNGAATFAGAFVGTGTIVNTGTLRLVGYASFPPGISLVNEGVLDLITWQGTLPAGFVNNGIILTRSAAAINRIAMAGAAINVTMPGYSGHTYQCQVTNSLQATNWTNIGSPVTGTGSPLTFTDPSGTASGPTRFYRIVVDP